LAPPQGELSAKLTEGVFYQATACGNLPVDGCEI